MRSYDLVNESRVGTTRLANGDWQFLLWAPYAQAVSVSLCSDGLVAMQELERGYHLALVPSVSEGSRYFYQMPDGRHLPDPASRFQPQGVHGPSEIVGGTRFQWTDQHWKGRPFEGSIFYELHVGTYTSEGTFDALIPHLAKLVELGVTTIELMPIAQFPGSRNWGYDGVYPFAPQNSYGGPSALRRFINAAHSLSLSIALDVVYNHLGPEGNYLSAFGPYFTERYRTPWGQAVNFDGQGSDEVKRFFIDNALNWIEEYHVDALRLDAVHGIFDFSACHFLAELQSEVAQLSHRLGRQVHLIAESDLNDSRVLHEPVQAGFALNAQWSDDFHHSVHTLLTNENQGYYEDFGGISPLLSTLQDGWYYQGQYSSHRQRRHGNSPVGIAPSRFVVCNQNHDQVGNRAAGERLSSLVSLDALKLAAGVTILSPFTPLLFMGEEYGEPAPFQYFTSHTDPALVEAVRRGRREEFSSFGWQESVPDPQDEQTFVRSHLSHSIKNEEPHRSLFEFYRQLIHMRAELELATAPEHKSRELGDRQILLSYHGHARNVAILFNFAEFPVTLEIPELDGNWTTRMNSAAAMAGARDAGAGEHSIHLAHYSFQVLERKRDLREAQ